MLKYMLTSYCPNSCKYCITRNVNIPETRKLNDVDEVLKRLRYKKEIMITGGEPTMALDYVPKVALAIKWFDKVFITSMNPKVLKGDGIYDAITFSLHNLNKIPKVKIRTPVYASILDHLYKPELINELKEKGYSGLTINENQWGNKEFKEELPIIDNFSIRVNKIGKCLDETIILPDLRVVDGFKEFM